MITKRNETTKIKRNRRITDRDRMIDMIARGITGRKIEKLKDRRIVKDRKIDKDRRKKDDRSKDKKIRRKESPKVHNLQMIVQMALRILRLKTGKGEETTDKGARIEADTEKTETDRRVAKEIDLAIKNEGIKIETETETETERIATNRRKRRKRRKRKATDEAEANQKIEKRSTIHDISTQY